MKNIAGVVLNTKRSLSKSSVQKVERNLTSLLQILYKVTSKVDDRVILTQGTKQRIPLKRIHLQNISCRTKWLQHAIYRPFA